MMHTHCAWSIDPWHNVLWCYDIENGRLVMYLPQPMCAVGKSVDAHLSFLRSPEFRVAITDSDECGGNVSGQLVTANMLAVLYACTARLVIPIKQNASALDRHTRREVHEERVRLCSTVDRFLAYGGGWGYAQQSVEAIQFCVNKDIVVGHVVMKGGAHRLQVHGVGLFGGRGEYTCRVRLLRADDELCVDGDTGDDVLYECAARDRAIVLFTRACVCAADQWYTLTAHITGPCSDCGAQGQSHVQCGDTGVVFRFRNSAFSNNGTDVNAGQIGQILYRVAVREQHVDDESVNGQVDMSLPMRNLLVVTPNGIGALLKLLRALVTASFGPSPAGQMMISSELKRYDQERCIVMAIMALRLLRWYMNLLYPAIAEPVSEPIEYTAFVGELNTLLGSIFERGHSTVLGEPAVLLLEEAVHTWLACAHLLCPCAALMQHRLSTLLLSDAARRDDWQLVAVLDALAALPQPHTTLMLEGDAATLHGAYPALIRHMFKQLHVRQIAPVNFATVLRFLLELCFAPATPSDAGMAQSHLRDAASRLLAQMTRELAALSNSTIRSPPIVQTPNRFVGRSSQPNWESTAAADAIAFRIEAATLSLHAVGVFVGGSSEYQYNLEVRC
jgi:hypothetical protein